MSKKSSKKNKNILSKFIFGVFFILFTILMVIIFYLKVLPEKYSIPFLIIYLVLNIILGIPILKKKTKKGTRTFISFLCIVFSVIFGFALNYLNSTMNFMDKIKALKYQTENYYLMVLDESSYEEVEDLASENIGVSANKSDTYDEAFSKLEDKVNVETLEYNDIVKLGEDLLDEEIEAVFINESSLSLIKDEIESFESDTRIIDTISIKVKTNISEKDVDVTEEPFNIYISGIDVYGNISSISRSDVNMVVTVNPKTNQILMTSIPRDYYVRLHGTTGYKDKLTHAGLYGIDMSISTIEDLLDIDINYYVRVNFTTLTNLVDVIGGIDVYSDYAFTSYHGKYKFKKGLNHMNGVQALGFVRERYAFKDGDRQRVKNQQAVLEAILNKALSSSTLITRYTKILNSLGNSFQTNMSSDKIYSLVNMQLDEAPNWNIEKINLDGTNSSNYTYSYSAQKLYVMEPDMDTVYEAKEKIDEVENIE